MIIGPRWRPGKLASAIGASTTKRSLLVSSEGNDRSLTRTSVGRKSGLVTNVSTPLPGTPAGGMTPSAGPGSGALLLLMLVLLSPWTRSRSS